MPITIPDFTDTDRLGTGRETHADPRDRVTTLLRVSVLPVPADGRTASEGTGSAR